MSPDSWVLEWHDRSGQQTIEVTESADDAVQVLRRFLSNQTLLATEPHGGPAPSAFDELFQGGSPTMLLRHARDLVQHECTNGRFVIRRGSAVPTDRAVPTADVWAATLFNRPATGSLSAHDRALRATRQSA